MAHIHFGDDTRQAALFEAMILAAGADGRVSKVEVETIFKRVFEHPEFHGIHAEDLREAIRHAADKVTAAHDLEHLLPSLAERIPDQESRKLAFQLAASVALSDNVADVRELNVLKALQAVFALSEREVAAEFEKAVSGGVR